MAAANTSLVTIGFSKPYVAKYANEGTSVTYTEGKILARGVSLSLEISKTSDNNFYADNTLAETEAGLFDSGKATLVIDGLSNESATMILGLSAPETLQVSDQSVQMQGYGKMTPPYVGFGCVRQTQYQGKVEYWPLILPKIKFDVPSDKMETQGESITWQTQELTAAIQRDDTAAADWKKISATGMATEAEAEAAVKAFFSIV